MSEIHMFDVTCWTCRILMWAPLVVLALLALVLFIVGAQ